MILALRRSRITTVFFSCHYVDICVAPACFCASQRKSRAIIAFMLLRAAQINSHHQQNALLSAPLKPSSRAGATSALCASTRRCVRGRESCAALLLASRGSRRPLYNAYLLGGLAAQSIFRQAGSALFSMVALCHGRGAGRSFSVLTAAYVERRRNIVKVTASLWCIHGTVTAGVWHVRSW